MTEDNQFYTRLSDLIFGNLTTKDIQAKEDPLVLFTAQLLELIWDASTPNLDEQDPIMQIIMKTNQPSDFRVSGVYIETSKTPLTRNKVRNLANQHDLKHGGSNSSVEDVFIYRK